MVRKINLCVIWTDKGRRELFGLYLSVHSGGRRNNFYIFIQESTWFSLGGVEKENSFLSCGEKNFILPFELEIFSKNKLCVKLNVIIVIFLTNPTQMCNFF